MDNRDRRSIRLSGFDYGHAGAYFVTVCTYHRHHVFGAVIASHVRLTRLGTIAQEQLDAIPTHFGTVSVAARIVMPNHVHLILVINEVTRRGVPWNAPTDSVLRPKAGIRTGPVPARQGLSVILRLNKGAVTTRAREAGLADIIWQRGYYEHIVRDDEEFSRIAEYIPDNPIRGDKDPENPMRGPG